MPRRTRTDITNAEAEQTALNAELDGAGAPTKAHLMAAALPTQPAASLKPLSGKLGQIHGLIAAPAGATIDDLVAATGWQQHTIRAAFSRLRRRGVPVVHTTDADGRKTYRLDVREG
jgi:hypothetical protein